MMVGRRHVAAASVATAYALHVYVLPNTIFNRPKPVIPPLSTHPHCPKVCAHLCSGYFLWVLVLHPFLSILATFLLLPYRFSRFSTAALPTLFRATCTFLANIYHPSFLRELHAGKRWTTPKRGASYCTVPDFLSHFGLSSSIHPFLTFFFFCSDFLSPLLILFVCLGLAVLYTRIEVVDIVLRSVSKLRKNDRVVAHSMDRISRCFPSMLLYSQIPFFFDVY